MFSLLSKKRANGLTGIFTDERGTAVVSVRNPGISDTSLRSLHYQANTSDSAESNEQLLKSQALDKQVCSTLLNIGEYQLLVVDAYDGKSRI